MEGRRWARAGLISLTLVVLSLLLAALADAGCQSSFSAADSSLTITTNINSNCPSGTTFTFAPNTKWRMGSTIEPLAADVLNGGPNSIFDGSICITGTESSCKNPDWTHGSGYYSVTASAAGVTLNSTTSGVTCGSRDPGCAYNQDLYLNDVPLVDVLPASFPPSPALTTGQWAADYVNNVIYMYDNPNGQTVELSSTPYAIASANDGVTIKGLTVQKYATAPADGAVQAASGWTVENGEIRFNHGEGLTFEQGSVPRSNDRFLSNLVHDNGNEGIAGGGCIGSPPCRIIGNRVYNNGWMDACAGGECGGIKISNVLNAVVENNQLRNNDGDGIWTDAGSGGVIILHNAVSDSTQEGIRIEVSGYNGGVNQVLSNTLTDNGQTPVRLTGLMFSATGACAGYAEIDVVASSFNTKVTNNLITTNCGGILVRAGPNDYTHDNFIEGNSLTYCGSEPLNSSALIGGNDTTASWQPSTTYALGQAAPEGARWSLLDGNGNTVTAVSNCSSGNSVPRWCTGPIGCTTSDDAGDGNCTWKLRTFGRPVYNGNNAFRSNKYFFASSAQLTNENWMWSTTNQEGANPINWATWQAYGQDRLGTVNTSGASCNPTQRPRISGRKEIRGEE
jgi:hypothetical protein